MVLIAKQTRLLALSIALFVVACYQSPARNAAEISPPIGNDAPLALQKTQQNQVILDKTRLKAAALAGGEYLLRVQKNDGSFHYSYNPAKDEFDKHTYNILRHAGTIYALFQLYEATNDARYLEATRRAMNFLKSRFRLSSTKNALYVLDFDGKAKLGANGLALLAMVKQLELDAKSASLADANRLAKMILALQHQDGSFTSYHPVRGDEPEGQVSLYYPGEAILGLVGLYKITKDQRLLEAAQRGGDFLIASQRQFEQLPPDAWLMQALEALHKIKRQQKYLDHAVAIAETMISFQYSEEDSIEYAGGFAPGVPRATPAASRSEGILAAYRMAREAKDGHAAKLENALKLSARFQLSQQFTSDNQFNLPNPQGAMGGFRESVETLRVRIDFVQHNISALLGLAQSLY
jgi:hypothetical protein